MVKRPTETSDELFAGQGVELVSLRLMIPSSSLDFDDFNEVVRTIHPCVHGMNEDMPMSLRMDLLRMAIRILEEVLAEQTVESLGVEGEDWGKSEGVTLG